MTTREYWTTFIYALALVMLFWLGIGAAQVHTQTRQLDRLELESHIENIREHKAMLDQLNRERMAVIMRERMEAN